MYKFKQRNAKLDEFQKFIQSILQMYGWMKMVEFHEKYNLELILLHLCFICLSVVI